MTKIIFIVFYIVLDVLVFILLYFVVVPLCSLLRDSGRQDRLWKLHLVLLVTAWCQTSWLCQQLRNLFFWCKINSRSPTLSSWIPSSIAQTKISRIVTCRTEFCLTVSGPACLFLTCLISEFSIFMRRYTKLTSYYSVLALDINCAISGKLQIED